MGTTRRGITSPVTGIVVQRGLGHVEIFEDPAAVSAGSIAQLRLALRAELDAIWKAINRIASEAGVMPAPWERKV